MYTLKFTCYAAQYSIGKKLDICISINETFLNKPFKPKKDIYMFWRACMSSGSRLWSCSSTTTSPPHSPCSASKAHFTIINRHRDMCTLKNGSPHSLFSKYIPFSNSLQQLENISKLPGVSKCTHICTGRKLWNRLYVNCTQRGGGEKIYTNVNPLLWKKSFP